MPTSVAAYLEENVDVWDRIVAKYGLRSRNLRQLVGQGDQHADFAFAYGAPEGPRAFVSTIKLRQAGFTRTIDTEDSFRDALQSLIDQKLRPRREVIADNVSGVRMRLLQGKQVVLARHNGISRWLLGTLSWAPETTLVKPQFTGIGRHAIWLCSKAKRLL